MIALALSGVSALIEPTEIYNGGYNLSSNNTALLIATGGARQSGLVKGLSCQLNSDRSANLSSSSSRCFHSGQRQEWFTAF